MVLSTKALLSELQWVARFIEKKSTIPILQDALFEANGSTLTLTATDLEVGAITTVKGTGKGKWSCAAPIFRLIKYLAKVEEDAVELSADNTHWLTVTHGGNGKVRTAGMSRESFPDLPETPPTLCVLKGLPLAVDRTAFAISKEESRFTLNGGLLEVNDEDGKLVTTDGCRLSLAPLRAERQAKVHALIPQKALLEAARLDMDCEFSLDDDHVFLDFGQRKVLARKLTGNFPDYWRALPKEFPAHAFLPIEQTLKVLKRVAVYADERSRAIGFGIKDGNLKLWATTTENGQAEGTIPIQIGESNGPLEAGYNADFLADFLSRDEEEYAAFCWSNLKSVIALMSSDGWVNAIMPMEV